MVSTKANEGAKVSEEEKIQGLVGGGQKTQLREGTLDEFGSISEIVGTPNLSNSSELIKQSISASSEGKLIAEEKLINEKIIKCQQKFVNFGIDIPEHTKQNLGNLFGKDPLVLAKKTLYQNVLYLQFLSKNSENIQKSIDNAVAKKLEGTYKIGDPESIESGKDARTIMMDSLKASLFHGKEAAREKINKITGLHFLKKKNANMKANAIKKQFEEGKINNTATTLYSSFSFADKVPGVTIAKKLHMSLTRGFDIANKIHHYTRRVCMQLEIQLKRKYIDQKTFEEIMAINKSVYEKKTGGITDPSVMNLFNYA